MLFLIGLGLSEGDISIKAINAIKKCDAVYAEFYTNKFLGDLKNIEKITGKKIEILSREKTESDFIINEAKKKSIALLIAGDPLTATTHTELLFEAKKQKIKTEIIHAPSIFTAVAESGLQLYKFGRTVTLAFPEKGFEPESPYEMIFENKKSGLHTLLLLDTKNGEKFMTIKKGLEMLAKNKTINESTKLIACCALGSDEQAIKYNFPKNLGKIKQTPASIIIPGKLNFKEEEFLETL
ncbi:MAG TPA: diphthine synthase [archaeon]|nr:diphthine synthase [archaeon]